MDDVWREPIEMWLDGLGTRDDFSPYLDGSYGYPIPAAKRADVRKEQTTIYDIVRYALGRRPGEMTQRDRLRVGAILTKIGWTYSHKSHGRSAYTRVTRSESA